MSIPSKANREIWTRENGSRSEEFEVDIYLGKKTNLLALKKDIVSSIKKQLKYYKDSREKLFTESELEYVATCPVTGISTEETDHVATIYGGEYVQTPDTGHVYLRKRPTKKAIHNFYLNDVNYATTYTNREGAEFRLQSIAVPWKNWVKEVYFKEYGSYPKKVLDIGSGAGHFVEACRRDGIVANGIELSESSRNFAREIWEIDMDGRDFLETGDDYKGYDVITFWGLLEHTPNPGALLDKTFELLKENPKAMVIAKLPRWNSLSSASQILNPGTVIRHIDPMGHIMLFSDASAAELFYRHHFKPHAAWYYGMDVYECLMQLGNKTGTYTHFTESGDFQMELQQFIDDIRFSDGLTLVATPNDRS